MTEDKKWMNKLKKVLAQIPEGKALAVNVVSIGTACIELCDKKEIDYHHSNNSMSGFASGEKQPKPYESFCSINIYPNSECI